MKKCLLCKQRKLDSEFKMKLNGRINASCNACLDKTREMPPIVPARIRLPKPQPTPGELLKRESVKAYRASYERTGKSKYARYRARAEKKELSFDLTFDQFLSLIDQNCHYCGGQPRVGVDRRDSGQGYVMDNCLPCCKRCNLAKNDMRYEEFLDHVARISAHMLQNR